MLHHSKFYHTNIYNLDHLNVPIKAKKENGCCVTQTHTPQLHDIWICHESNISSILPNLPLKAHAILRPNLPQRHHQRVQV